MPSCKLTISKIPLDLAARANAFSPSGLMSFANPVGHTNIGILTGILRTVDDVSTTATFFMTLGLNQTRLIMASLASRVQQSVAAVE